ncbi:hypothetical protein [Hahella sp. NBU794]|uniref:hypothetical protein n=1 Tax=Hahella sp. NBU794 TaxID=3422590 RepID=UPI003D6E971F
MQFDSWLVTSEWKADYRLSTRHFFCLFKHPTEKRIATLFFSMKSKTRLITVNDARYVWLVDEVEWNLLKLKVWREGEKSAPWFTLDKDVNIPWRFSPEIAETTPDIAFSVTPKLVAEAIRQIGSQFGFPGENSKTLNLCVSADGKSILPLSAEASPSF